MRRTGLAACLCALLLPAAALAQAPAAQSPAAPTSDSRVWIVAGAGFAAARAGCPTCDSEGVYTTSRSFLVDAGMRINPRVDAGIELFWVSLKVDGTAPIQTTFLLGLAQFRPWVDHGLFLRAGMGIGIAGNGLYNPIGPPLAPPFTTNALGIAYGVGWEFRLARHWGVQVHGMQHVAALGELTTTAGTSVKNVVGNYWTVGGAVVIR
jgi:hypothetical protein